jgi:hypothetical protein
MELDYDKIVGDSKPGWYMSTIHVVYHNAVSLDKMFINTLERCPRESIVPLFGGVL